MKDGKVCKNLVAGPKAGAGKFAAARVVNLRTADFELRSPIVWRRSSIVISRGH